MSKVEKLHKQNKKDYVLMICTNCHNSWQSFFKPYHVNTNHTFEDDPCPQCGNVKNMFVVGDIELIVIPRKDGDCDTLLMNKEGGSI